MARRHAGIALGLVGTGWLVVAFVLWRLYPDQPPARLLFTLGTGLSAWGLLWFPAYLLHRQRLGDGREDPPGVIWERIWRRSGWAALGVAALVMLALQRALRTDWFLLFLFLLLGAEGLWAATEPPPTLHPRRSGRGARRVDGETRR